MDNENFFLTDQNNLVVKLDQPMEYNYFIQVSSDFGTPAYLPVNVKVQSISDAINQPPFFENTIVGLMIDLD